MGSIARWLVVCSLVLAPAVARAQAEDPGSGQPFFALRDLNLAQYEPDFAWQRTSEREHQRKSGVDLWVGSISQKDIVLSRRVQINAPLAGDRLRFRWHHEQYGDPELGITTEMLQLQARVAGPVSLTIFSSGAFEKSGIAVGGGVLVAPGDRTSYLELAIRHDGPAYNSKAHEDARYREPPVRLLAETNVERGRLRVYAIADWALASRREFGSPGPDAIRDEERYTRRTMEKLEWTVRPDFHAGIRHRYASQRDDREYFATEDAPVDRDFTREHHAVDAYAERRLPAFRFRASAGVLSQRDRTDPALGTDETFARDAFLFGARAHRSLTPEIELGAGYWGSSLVAERRGTSPRTLKTYADKVDGVFGYHFNDVARGELVFSHEVSAGGFGGASLKALFLF